MGKKYCEFPTSPLLYTINKSLLDTGQYDNYPINNKEKEYNKCCCNLNITIVTNDKKPAIEFI